MAPDTSASYRPLDEPTLRRFLAGLQEIRGRLGDPPEKWRIREVGDGNLNLVFLVDGPAGSVCVKQSLPYVRAAGENWPMPLERTFYEYTYFRLVAPKVGSLIPAMLHYEPALYCLIMEQLSPHIILRRGLVSGRRYPRCARDVAEFVALTSFFTSDLAVPLEEKMAAQAIFAGNSALCRITSDLVFADPYRIAARNRWTSPQLDDMAAEFRQDGALKVAAARFGHKFLTQAQSLIHGDLHTGSIMVTESDTRIIDAEFAFFGPSAFDLGAFIANLLMSYFSQDGHANAAAPRLEMQAWLLEQIEIFWSHFCDRFAALWRAEAKGDAYPANLFADPAGREALLGEQKRVLDQLFADMVGFTAMKTIRRILGFAHNIDFEWIADPDRRADCEAAALRLARTMLLHPAQFTRIGDLTAAARSCRAETRHAAGAFGG
jgi:5-methylthioribose kinase